MHTASRCMGLQTRRFVQRHRDMFGMTKRSRGVRVFGAFKRRSEKVIHSP